MWSFGIIMPKKPFIDCVSMTMQFKTCPFHTMISFSSPQVTNSMEKCLFGTQPTGRLYRLFRSLLKFSQMESPQFAGVDSSRILSWEIRFLINSQLLAQKNWLYGSLTQKKVNARMSFCQLVLWSGTTLTSNSLSQTKNFYSLDLNLETFALSKLRTRCLYLLNLFALKVSKTFRQ